MLAMVASSTTISCAIEMSTSAQPRWTCAARTRSSPSSWSRTWGSLSVMVVLRCRAGSGLVTGADGRVSAAGRMIWSMTRSIEVVGRRARRAGRGGAGRSRPAPGRAGRGRRRRGSRRGRGRARRSRCDAAILGPSTSRRKAAANSSSRLIAVRTLANVGRRSGWSVRPPSPQNDGDQVAAQGAGVGRLGGVALCRDAARR